MNKDRLKMSRAYNIFYKDGTIGYVESVKYIEISNECVTFHNKHNHIIKFINTSYLKSILLKKYE